MNKIIKPKLINTILKFILLGIATFLIASEFYFLIDLNNFNYINIIYFFINITFSYAIIILVIEKEKMIKINMVILEICTISLIFSISSLIKHKSAYIPNGICGTMPTQSSENIFFITLIHCFIAIKMIIFAKCITINSFIKKIIKYLIDIAIILFAILFIFGIYHHDFIVLNLYFILLLISMLQFVVINLIKVVKTKVKNIHLV